MSTERSQDSNGYLFVALGFGAVAMFGSLAAVTGTIGPASIPIWGIAVGGVALFLRGPVGQAIGRRIGGDPPSAHQQLEVPPELYGELDELRARMLEMEERQDFSERLLASQTNAKPENGGT